ncbi:MAG: hypothetical protein J6J16_03490 [Lachnospiraceae bacterium]|nr:hypothetical protein [Lachnospiraceae bacterium]
MYDIIWGLRNVWWIYAIAFVIFLISQFIATSIMLMDGEEILNQYRLPIWHKTHSSKTRLEEIVREVQTTRQNFLYRANYLSSAASQLYQLLRIKSGAHDEVYRKHMMMTIMVDNITIEEYQEIILENFHNAGCHWISTQEDMEIIKSLTDIYITMYVANRMTGMPPKMDNGLFDIRSPYEKEMEWRRRS